MATTTNYGWETPDDTDLVKDGAAAIRTLGSSIDTTTKNLNPETTTGDIAYRSATANTNTRLAIGSAGQVLTVSAGVPSWATPSGSSGPAFRANRTSNYSISQNTWTKVNYNEEDFDTAGNYDPTTNFRFTPTTAGYYQFNYEGQIVGTEGQLMTIALYKNGASYHSGSAVDISGQGYGQVSSSDLVYMNGSSDYVEVYLYTSASGANIGGNATGNVSVFSGIWIRS